MATKYTAPAQPLEMPLECPVSFSKLTNVTPQTVRNWLKRGIIKPVIQCGKIVRFERAAALAALQGERLAK